MPTLELTDDQVIELVKQLPADRRKNTLLALAAEAATERASRMKYAEEQLRQQCAQRGKDWDAMTEDDREALIDELIHEDRPCARP